MTEHIEEGTWPPRWDEGGRDPRLGWFGIGGALDGAAPSPMTVAVLDELAERSGPERRRFAGSTHAEDTGILAAARALEGHAAWLKLTAVAQVIRRHVPETPAGRLPGPDSWDTGLLHDIAVVLRIAWQSAWPVAELAWQLDARLPGVGDLLRDGVLTWLTAKIVAEEFSVLDDEKAAEAERRLLERDLGADDMTPGKLRRLCQRIADELDPEGAARRREQKQRDEARVTFFRDHGGAATLVAMGLPPDEALKSDANIQKRALEYKAAGIKEKMDLLRVLALTDSINGVDVPARYALWRAEQADRERAGGDGPDHPGDEDGVAGEDASGEDEPADADPRDEDGPGDDDGPGDGNGPGGNGGTGGPGGRGPGGGPGPAPAGKPDPGLPSLVNFTLPLATVLGQAQRPGEAPGYGSLDPALVRKLADAAAASPRSSLHMTFTDQNGYAAAHGCARLIREKPDNRHKGRRGKGSGPPGGFARDDWSFTRDTTRPGPEGGYGAWILRLPDGRRYRVHMHKIPVYECDHTYETDAYRPSALLRHLVEIRDGECTSTVCSHPARLSDFEHAVPYHAGGKTDACNGGARSRRCHRVKQSPGWRVSQPRPAWHRWDAPSGRSYTKGPKEYPA